MLVSWLAALRRNLSNAYFLSLSLFVPVVLKPLKECITCFDVLQDKNVCCGYCNDGKNGLH